MPLSSSSDAQRQSEPVAQAITEPLARLADTAAQPSPGATTTEPLAAVPGYEVLEELGRGGMGVVYKARHLGLNRIVALKMILAAEHAGTEELRRFRAEAEAIARLQHPNIIQIFDIGEQHGKPYFALELVEGGSLAAKLHGEPQPPRDAALLVEVLARAMEVAHQKSIVHRDLKPANVLLTNAGQPRITDFGLAKSLDRDAGRTQSGAILGTPSYMAPEQAAGHTHAIGPATDGYALGAILYEALTGRPPFRGATVLDTLALVVASEPVPPSRLTARLPRDLETICLKCLQKEPARRYPSALALADDLRRYLDDRPIVARPVGRWEQLGKFVRRNKLLVGSIVAVTLALVLGIIGTALGMKEARAAEGVAIKNLQRAVAAENEMRRDLARSHWDNARLEAGHGRWRQALALFDKALEAGFEDEIAVRLQKVTALLALQENNIAEKEITALAQRPDLGPWEGTLLLARGDLALGKGSGQEQALADVRQALQKGLPPDEAAYAQALLADWPQDAVVHLRQALKINPSRPGARQHLFPLLMSLGRFDECKQEASTLLAFFPDDPSSMIFLSIVSLLEGNIDAARAQLRQTEAQLGKERTAVLVDVVDVLHSALQAAATSDQPSVPITLVPRLIYLKSRFERLDARGGPTPDFHAVNLPALAHVWKPLAAALVDLPAGRSFQKHASALEEVVAHHPEGLACFLYAMALTGLATREKGAAALPLLRRAEEAYRRAMDAPITLPPVRRLARFWGTYAQSLLCHPGDKAPPDPQMRTLAEGNMRRLLADGNLSAAQCITLTDLAFHRLQDLDLARLLAATGQQQAPGNIALLRWRAQIELAAGAYHPALDAANKVLARLPKDPDALRVRQEATEKLKAAAQSGP